MNWEKEHFSKNFHLLNIYFGVHSFDLTHIFPLYYPVSMSQKIEVLIRKKKKLYLHHRIVGYSMTRSFLVLCCRYPFRPLFYIRLRYGPNRQSFTSLMADLHQDINRVSSFSRCLNGTFPWRNCSIKTLVNGTLLNQMRRLNNTSLLLWVD